jgi:hypothetical protein
VKTSLLTRNAIVSREDSVVPPSSLYIRPIPAILVILQRQGRELAEFSLNYPSRPDYCLLRLLVGPIVAPHPVRVPISVRQLDP